MDSSSLDDTLRPFLESDAIDLIDAAWLIDNADVLRPLPQRQDLPDDAFIPFKDLTFGFFSIVVLSHIWLGKLHPDPQGSTLELVVRALQMLVEKTPRVAKNWVVRRYGLFWEYASMYQHEDAKNGKRRTSEQEDKFQLGLKGIPLLFMHPHTKSFNSPSFRFRTINRSDTTPSLIFRVVGPMQNVAGRHWSKTW